MHKAKNLDLDLGSLFHFRSATLAQNETALAAAEIEFTLYQNDRLTRGIGHANIPHIKDMDGPFHLIYSSLICAKR